MSPETIFVLVIIAMGLGAGPLYMRMLAHGPKPDVWWRGRRDGGLIFGILLLVIGVVCFLIGGVGATTLAWLLLVSAAFNLSAAGYSHLALRRLPPGDDRAEG
ncbi:MAG: hypothetical protein ACTHMU_26125 [Thermomicrobiales bacterium]